MAVFVFQESRRTNPFNFVHPFSSIPLFPPPSSSLSFYSDKARAQNLPGNLHTIKATASHDGGVRFDVISADAKGIPAIQSSSIIHIIFRPIYAVYPECDVNNRQRKVRCTDDCTRRPDLTTVFINLETITCIIINILISISDIL